MTIKNWLLIIALLALATVYAVWFTDWFKPKIIHISSTSRSTHVRQRQRARADGDEPAGIPPFIMLDPACKLTEVKVMRLSVWQTNHDALPLWHLISTSNSVPTAKFTYGRNIPGMQPAVAGTHAQPLEPEVMYHLFLKAGRAQGEHDFETKASD